MKIVHVLRKYNPREWGGIESHLYDLSKYLLSRGHQVVIIAPRLRGVRGNQPDPFSSLGIPVRRYHSFLPMVGIAPKARETLRRQGGNIFSASLLPKLLFEPGVSVIHSHALNRVGGIARLAARIKRIPFIVSIHGGYADLPQDITRIMTAGHHGGWDWGKPLGWAVRSRRVVEDARRVFVFNRVEHQRLTATLGSARVIRLPHAVVGNRACPDASAILAREYPRLSGRPFILCVSRISEAKQQHLLISAFARLAERHPELMLVLAGSLTNPQYANRLTNVIAASGLSHSVLMPGNIPPRSEQLAALYCKATAFVLPSRHEPLGIVILEAWAAGLPVIATRTSGASELIRHGETGLLVEHHATAIANAILRLMTDPGLRTRLSVTAARQVAQHHTPEQMGTQYLAALEQVTPRTGKDR